MTRSRSVAFILVAFTGCVESQSAGDAGPGGTIDAGSDTLDAAGADAHDQPSTDGGEDASTTGDGSTMGDGSMTGDAGPGPCVPVGCDPAHSWECGDCLDNDGDGLVDSADPDCLGPCHNHEAGFDLNIPAFDRAPCKLDCYYDSNPGSGDDGCSWDTRCDPLMPEMTCLYTSPPPSSLMCDTIPSTMCLDSCTPRTPNGCDCFGCCNLPSGSGDWVFLGSQDEFGVPTCSLDVVTDHSLCHPCTPNPTCLNTCERCELCLGRDPATIPADCFAPPPGDGGTPTDAGTSMRCAAGVQACGLPGDSTCAASYYCVTGCCIFFG